MTLNIPRTVPVLAGALAALASLPACATLGRGGPPEAEEPAAIHQPVSALDLPPAEFLRQARGTYVVVDLDANRLRLMDGRRLLWEAPVGTGTGLRLKGADGEWHFATPQGVFRIQYKEELPIWYLPDWYFIEKKLPIPPDDSPKRRQKGQLGVAAVYLGQDIAIHGTDRPELLGQRVSHGCIRLENKYAQRLFHNVQVGTPVVVLGGKELAKLPMPKTPPLEAPRKAKPDPVDGMSTPQLLARLDADLKRAVPSGDWVPVASRLITRGIKNDSLALRGLLERAGTARTEALNREYATFLADVFARGALRTAVSLSRIAPQARQRAAQSIVDATMALNALPATDPAAPWPTRRVPDSLLGPSGRAGLAALRAAEERYREGAATTVADSGNS